MTTFDNLDDTFDIVPTETESSLDSIQIESDHRDCEKDYEYSRNQLYNLIEKGQQAIDGIINVAKGSDHPRAYEVAFQGMKHVADMTDKLVDLQKKMKAIDDESIQKRGPTTVNNTMFVGSTAELQKFLKNQKEYTDK